MNPTLSADQPGADYPDIGCTKRVGDRSQDRDRVGRRLTAYGARRSEEDDCGKAASEPHCPLSLKPGYGRLTNPASAAGTGPHVTIERLHSGHTEAKVTSAAEPPDGPSAASGG